MQINLIHYIIFWTGTIALTRGIFQIFVLNRTINNTILSGFFICLGVTQIYLGFMLTGFLIDYPHFAMIHLPFVYFLGPIMYYYFKIISDDKFQFKVKHSLHILPGIILIIILIPIYILDVETKRAFFNNPASILQQKGISLIYPLVLGLILAAIFIYLIKFLKDSSFVWRKKYLINKDIILLPHITIILGNGLTIFFLCGFIFFNIFNSKYTEYLQFIEIFCIFLSIAILFIYIMLIRHSDFYMKFQMEYQKIRYEQSYIEGIDIDEVMENLNHIMSVEKLYCDEDLNINRLANALSLSSHQLSQIINEGLNKNFNTFVNEFRIKEAQDMLTEHPDKTITSIAYAVGFNTLSVFYKWFYQINGYAPGELRKKNNQKVYT